MDGATVLLGSRSLAPIAVADRNGVDETMHHGAGIVVGPAGERRAWTGDPSISIYPRSSLKPLQAAAMVDLGLDVPPDLLAVVCASHDGEDVHVDAVQRLLAHFELSEHDLGNVSAYPLSPSARDAMVCRDAPPDRLRMNCSGKHAGMLATCRINGWPIDGYLDQTHPLQHAITVAIEARGARVDHVGMDGCGAPAHVMPLDQCAVAMGSLAGSAVHRAMTAHPVLVGGRRRTDTVWMQSVPGLMAKEGAAGVMAFVLDDGTAGAFKIADGSDLARRAVFPESLRHAGVDPERHAEALDSTAVPVLGHGQQVGSVRALPWTATDERATTT